MSFLKKIFKTLSTIFKVVVFCATPFKSLMMYKMYFKFFGKTTNKANYYQNVVHSIQILLNLLAYFILLNFVRYFYQSSNQSLWHVLSYNTISMLHLPKNFYLLYILLSGLVIYYLKLFVFNSNLHFNTVMENVLFKNGYNQFFNKKQTHSKFKHSSKAFIQKVIFLTNVIESFIVITDIALGISFILHFAQLCSQLDLTLQKLCFLPLFFIHATVYFAFFYTFTTILCFAASFGFTTILYSFLLVKQNNADISQQIKNMENFKKLECSLHTNYSVINFTFIANNFFKNALLAFLFINFPANALFVVRLLFGKKLDGFSFLVVIGFASHQLIGTVLLHVCLARFNQYLTTSTISLLMTFMGRHCKDKLQNQTKNSQRNDSLLSRLKMTTHAIRLSTVNGAFTYGIIGTPVSMATFARVSF